MEGELHRWSPYELQRPGGAYCACKCIPILPCQLLHLLTHSKNIGLQAKIISQRTFTIFVVMALVTTFATTPLTTALYPPWYRKKLAAWKRGEIDWDGNSLRQDAHSSDDAGLTISSDKLAATEIRRLLMYLRLESLPSLLTFLSLLGGDRPEGGIRVHPSKKGAGVTEETTPLLPKRPLQVHGLRMLELTERLSSVMKDSEIEEVATTDPVVNSFYSFGQLNNLAVSGEVEIVPEGSYAQTVAQLAAQQASDMVFLPWSESGSLSETGSTTVEHTTHHRHDNGPHSQFISTFLKQAPCHTAVFVNNGFGTLVKGERPGLRRNKSRVSLRSNHGHSSAPVADRGHHIFFPFFGGMDDRTAMRFVLRLARNANVTATILSVDVEQEAQEQGFFSSMKDSLPQELESRVLFDTINTSQPLNDIYNRAISEVGQSTKSSGDLIVLGRGRESKISFKSELQHVLSTAGHTSHAGSDLSQSLGDVAHTLISMEVKASLLVVQAKNGDLNS